MPRLLYAILFSLFITAAQGQSALFVDTTVTPQQMVQDFFNTTQVSVSNVTYSGSPAAAGYFEAANTDLDLLAGIMLSSGAASLAADSVGTFASWTNNTSSDAQLEALTTGTTFDAASLEFDLVSQTDTLCFIYRFGSEEYPEYTCTNFNDVFGFFVSGPGYAPGTNIALVPGDNLPVAINNVHNDAYASGDSSQFCPAINAAYYVDYQFLNGQHAAYDGFTTTLPAKFVVQPGETYHVKLAIADVSDQVFDSGVFIAINSLGGDSLLSPVAGMAAPTIDGNTVTFTNTSHYGTAWHWDFGDGTVSNERYPAPHTYTQLGPNGEERTTYVVTLITTNYCCADTVTMIVNLGASGIAEIAPASFSLAPNPTTDYLFIQPTTADAFTVRVSDVTGRLLRQETGTASLRLDVASWLPGIYVVEFQQGNQVTRQRFMKK